MMNNIYSWRPDARLKGLKGSDAQTVGEHLEALSSDKDITRLKPQMVVDAAKNDSVLYRHFEWDDGECGILHRRDQARSLLNSLRVERIVDNQSVIVPAFVSITAVGETGPSYRSIVDVENSAELQRDVMRDALKDLRGWLNRYSMLAHICDLVRPALAALEVEQAKYEAAAATAAVSVKNKPAKSAKPRSVAPTQPGV